MGSMVIDSVEMEQVVEVTGVVDLVMKVGIVKKVVVVAVKNFLKLVKVVVATILVK